MLRNAILDNVRIGRPILANVDSPVSRHDIYGNLIPGRDGGTG